MKGHFPNPKRDTAYVITTLQAKLQVLCSQNGRVFAVSGSEPPPTRAAPVPDLTQADLELLSLRQRGLRTALRTLLKRRIRLL